MTKHDQLQIEQAGKGCVSGTLAEWPDLGAALYRAGVVVHPQVDAIALREICKLVLENQRLRAIEAAAKEVRLMCGDYPWEFWDDDEQATLTKLSDALDAKPVPADAGKERR